MTQTVRKVVFPVAGLGTRFLPATKAVPKEMLPVVDRPLIQWAVEEAAAAGCNEFIFVSSPHKRVILEHFSPARAYEEVLEARGKHDEMALLQAGLPENAILTVVFQDKPLGSDTPFGVRARLSAMSLSQSFYPMTWYCMERAACHKWLNNMNSLAAIWSPLKRFPTTRRNAMACWTPVPKPAHWWPSRVLLKNPPLQMRPQFGDYWPLYS